MPALPDTALKERLDSLADTCLQCYQCGQCTSACPSGWDLDRGPRRVVRLILAADAGPLLDCDDVWRCSECGACTRACPMEVDTAAAMAAVRDLQRRFGGASCPERRAADIAARHLQRRSRIENLSFGAAMVSRGVIPKDLAGAAVQGTASALSLAGRVRTRLTGAAGPRHAHPPTTALVTSTPNGMETQPFFAGCALPQDPHAYALTHEVAASLGLDLQETPGAGCCGHPARGAHAATYCAEGPALTACPACDASLREAGQATRPLWEDLVERARREDRPLRAAAPAFVPYVGCLGERDATLAALADAAESAGAEMVTSFPSLHSSCCGALGGMFRGETAASRRLLDFAAAKQAPIVTTCLLCRDNLRSAARRRRLGLQVCFWPEFFSVPRTAPAVSSGPSPTKDMTT